MESEDFIIISLLQSYDVSYIVYLFSGKFFQESKTTINPDRATF